MRARWGRPVIKALAIETPADLERVALYEEVADLLLFDAKAPADPNIPPGGNGLPFDWSLVEGRALPDQWILSGGLTPENITAALSVTKAPGYDVSSGVESQRGVKDSQRIRAFIEAARAADAALR